MHFCLFAQFCRADGGHQALDGMGGNAVGLEVAFPDGAAQGADFVRGFRGDVQHDLPEEVLAAAGVGQGRFVVNSFDCADGFSRALGIIFFQLELLFRLEFEDFFPILLITQLAGGDVVPDGLFQEGGVQGFGEVVGKTGLHVHLPAAGHRVGGEDDGGGAAVSGVGILADHIQGLDAVRFWHHMVEEDQVVRVPTALGQRLAAVGAQVDFDFRFLQEGGDNAQVRAVVVHGQDPRLRRGKGAGAADGIRLDGLPDGFGIGGHRGFVGDLLRQFHGETGALVVFGFHADGAVHAVHDVADDSQAESGSLDAAVDLQVAAAEGLEQVVAVLLADAAAGVLHGQLQAVDFVFLFGDGGFVFPADEYGDLAPVGIFNGVADEVQQDLLDAEFIAVHAVRDAGGHGNFKGEALLVRLFPGDEGDIRQELCEAVVRRGDFQHAGLNAGEVQHVVHQAQEHPPGALDGIGVVFDFRILVLAQDHLIHAEDGVDRGADLVGHAGEEVRLGPGKLHRALLFQLGVPHIPELLGNGEQEQEQQAHEDQGAVVGYGGREDHRDLTHAEEHHADEADGGIPVGLQVSLPVFADQDPQLRQHERGQHEVDKGQGIVEFDQAGEMQHGAEDEHRQGDDVHHHVGFAVALLLQGGHIGDVRERKQQADQEGCDAVNMVIAEHEGIKIRVQQDPRRCNAHAQGNIDDAEDVLPADLQKQADEQHQAGNRQDDQSQGEGCAVFLHDHPVQVCPGTHRHFEYPAGGGVLAPVVADGDRLPGVLRLQRGKEVYGLQQPAGQLHAGSAEAVDLLPVDQDFGIVKGQEADIVPVPDAVRERSVHFEYAVFVVFIPLVRGDIDGISASVPGLQSVQVDDVAAPGFNLRVGHGVDGGADGRE